MRTAAAVIGGLMVAALGAVVVGIPLTKSIQHIGGIAVGFAAAGALAVTVAVLAPSAGKAWRRVTLIAALLSFAAPAQFFRWSERVTSGAEELANLGRSVTLAIGLVGIALGLAFLMVAWLAGRDHHGPPPQ